MFEKPAPYVPHIGGDLHIFPFLLQKEEREFLQKMVWNYFLPAEQRVYDLLHVAVADLMMYPQMDARYVLQSLDYLYESFSFQAEVSKELLYFTVSDSDIKPLMERLQPGPLERVLEKLAEFDAPHLGGHYGRDDTVAYEVITNRVRTLLQSLRPFCRGAVEFVEGQLRILVLINPDESNKIPRKWLLIRMVPPFPAARDDSTDEAQIMPNGEVEFARKQAPSTQEQPEVLVSQPTVVGQGPLITKSPPKQAINLKAQYDEAVSAGYKGNFTQWMFERPRKPPVLMGDLADVPSTLIVKKPAPGRPMASLTPRDRSAEATPVEETTTGYLQVDEVDENERTPFAKPYSAEDQELQDTLNNVLVSHRDIPGENSASAEAYVASVRKNARLLPPPGSEQGQTEGSLVEAYALAVDEGFEGNLFKWTNSNFPGRTWETLTPEDRQAFTTPKQAQMNPQKPEEPGSEMQVGAGPAQ